MDVFFKTLPKRCKTKKVGIYFKQIEKTVIDDKGNIKITILKDDRVYCIQYKDIDNKWKFKTIGKYSDGIREAYCNNTRTDIMNKSRLGEQPEIIKKKNKKDIFTFDDGFLLFEKPRKLENKSIHRVTLMYKMYIYPIFGNTDINQITVDDIVDFRHSLIDKKLAQSTINGTITLIGTIFNSAIEDGAYNKANPIKSKKLKAFKLDNARDRYLTTSEINILLENIKENEVLYMFIKLALSTGGRVETILNIQKKDLNLDNGTITLKDLKNNSTYKGFLNKKLIKELKLICDNLTINSYIVGGKLAKFPRSTIGRHAKKVYDKLFNIGLDKKDAKNRVVSHTLRHTFASHLAINGTPIFTIQNLLNHSDIKHTMRYAKLAPDSGKNDVEDLYK